MTIALSLKKFTTAAVVAAPLTLVVACGSNGDEADQEAAAESTVTSEATASSEDATDAEEETSAENEDENAEGDDADDADSSEGSATAAAGSNTESGADSTRSARSAGGAAAAAGGEATRVENPLENGDITVAKQPPVEGPAANEQDSQEIRGLVENSYNQDSLHDFISYLPDNTCSRVIEANGGPESFNLNGVPDMPMSDMPGWSEMRVSDISDVNVDGEEASASVTVQTAEGPSTETQRFLREGGQWKFCDA